MTKRTLEKIAKAIVDDADSAGGVARVRGALISELRVALDDRVRGLPGADDPRPTQAVNPPTPSRDRARLIIAQARSAGDALDFGFGLEAKIMAALDETRVVEAGVAQTTTVGPSNVDGTCAVGRASGEEQGSCKPEVPGSIPGPSLDPTNPRTTNPERTDRRFVSSDDLTAVEKFTDSWAETPSSVALMQKALVKIIADVRDDMERRFEQRTDYALPEGDRKNLDEIIAQAVLDPTYEDACARVAIWENDRAVRQALRGERDSHTGALWNTCFGYAFRQLSEAWAKRAPQCAETAVREDTEKECVQK